MCNEFYSSQIRDELYKVLDAYCIGSNTYRSTITEVVMRFFADKHPEVQLAFVNHTEPVWSETGAFFFAWVEDGHLFAEALEWRL